MPLSVLLLLLWGSVSSGRRGVVVLWSGPLSS